MKVLFKGKIIGTNTFYSEKKGKDIFEFDVYDGKDLVRVTGIPRDVYQSVSVDSLFEHVVKVYGNAQGLYVVYDSSESQSVDIFV